MACFRRRRQLRTRTQRIAIKSKSKKREKSSTTKSALPKGAEAALWSITEVVPDPRNHFAIKDPTSELRLSDEERQRAADEAARLRSMHQRPAEVAAAKRAKQARHDALEKHDRLVRDRMSGDAESREPVRSA